MIVKLLTEHYLKFVSLKGGCRGWFESTHVKMPHCWKFHALAQLLLLLFSETGCQELGLQPALLETVLLCILQSPQYVPVDLRFDLFVLVGTKPT